MAAQADGTIYINTAIDTDGFKAGSREVEAAARRMASSVAGIGRTAELAMQKQVDAFAKQNQMYAQQEAKVESLKAKLSDLKSQQVPTDTYKALVAELEKTEAAFNNIVDRQEKFIATGGKKNSSAFKGMEYDLEKLGDKFRELEAQKAKLEASGQAYQPIDTSGIEKELAVEQERLRQSGNMLGTVYESLQEKAAGYSVTLMENAQAERLSTRVKTALVSGLKNLAAAAGNAASRLAKMVGSKIVSGLKSITNHVKNAAAAFLGLKKHTNSASSAFNNGLKTILKYGFGIRSLYILVRKLREAIKQGFNNLAQFSSETNQQLSAVKSSLTQFKNSLATAFAPLLSVIAPALTKVLNLLSAAATRAGMLIAALTGAKTFTKAIAVQEDYAASLGKSGKAATKAKKDLNGYLSGLDEVKRFEDKNKDDTEDITAGISPADMFEEAPILQSIKDLAAKIKEMIAAEDWEGIGALLAEKVNTGLQKIYDVISWDNVGPKISKFIMAFAGVFNSLVDNIDWDLLGHTIGAGINTIVNTFNLLATAINWENIGSSIAEGLNGLFDEVNFEAVGQLLMQRISIAFDMLYGFVTTFDFGKFGDSMGELINGAISMINPDKWSSAIAGLVNGIVTAIQNFIKTTDVAGLALKLADWLNQTIKKINFEDIGRTLVDVVAAAITFLGTLLGEIDWAGLINSIGDVLKGVFGRTQEYLAGVDWIQVGKDIYAKFKETAEGIDFAGVAESLFKLLGTALIAAVELIGSFVLEVITDVADYFKQYITDENGDGQWGAGEIIAGFLQGIWDAIKNVGTWIYEHIFKPFVEGIKEAFDIHSPSKVMIKLGKMITQGLLDGISSLVEKITEIWENVKQSVTEKVTQTRDKVKERFTELKDKAIEIFENTKARVKEKIASIKSDIETTFTNAKDKAISTFTSMKDRITQTFTSLKDALRTPINAIIGFINRLISGVVNGINNMTASLNQLRFDVPSWVPGIGGNSLGFNIPRLTAMQIPMLASGAVIPPNSPFMAVLGDQPRGNNIEAPEELLRKIVREESGQTRGGTYQFSANINRRVLFDEIIEEGKLRQTISAKNPFELA